MDIKVDVQSKIAPHSRLTMGIFEQIVTQIHGSEKQIDSLLFQVNQNRPDLLLELSRCVNLSKKKKNSILSNVDIRVEVLPNNNLTFVSKTLDRILGFPRISEAAEKLSIDRNCEKNSEPGLGV